MAYATPSERVQLRADSEAAGFPYVYTLLIEKDGRQSEFPCDDIGDALDLSDAWFKDHGAEYVEIFRVLDDGTLNPTRGPAQ